ncbi:MAG: RecB-family nuclease [Thermofilaceae archaeon]|nr:RecB-family nuclease [Thermofilaceae archaeon]
MPQGTIILPLLHNVYSQQKVVEVARVVYGLGFQVFIVTKASGTAAQTGVPEAQKLAIRLNRTLFYLPDLPDAIEVLKPDKVVLVVPRKYAQVELLKVARELSGKLLIVFGGAEPGLSKKELEMGLAVYPDYVEEDLGTTGLVAVSLYLLRTLGRTL